MTPEDRLKALLQAQAAPKEDARFELAVMEALAKRLLRQELMARCGLGLAMAALLTAVVIAGTGPDPQVLWSLLAGFGAMGVAAAVVVSLRSAP